MTRHSATPMPRFLAPSLQRGAVVAGKYTLERVVGRGGMGHVWAANHRQLDALVAIKFIDPALARNPGARARFEREARAAAKLRSQHIVQVHDHGIDHETPFIVMELLEGQDLSRRIRERGRLSPAEVAIILTQAAKGLGTAHEGGVVHRDLKPANIFLAKVDGEEVVKVVDFGVAKTPSESVRTQVGQLVGSTDYMSPEQVNGGRELGPSSDLWSLGAIAYRAVTGVLPFAGASVTETLERIRRGARRRASEVAADVPREFDAFFERAFARDPHDRFGTARELAAAFAAIVDKLPPAVAGKRTRAVPVADPAPEHDGAGRTLTQVYRPIEPFARQPRRIAWSVGGVAGILACAAVVLVASRGRPVLLQHGALQAALATGGAARSTREAEARASAPQPVVVRPADPTPAPVGAPPPEERRSRASEVASPERRAPQRPAAAGKHGPATSPAPESPAPRKPQSSGEARLPLAY